MWPFKQNFMFGEAPNDQLLPILSEGYGLPYFFVLLKRLNYDLVCFE